MKHFNLKTLTLAATIAGSLVAGNVYAQEEDANLDLGNVKIGTLSSSGKNGCGINNNNEKKWEGKVYFGSPGGPNARVGFIKANNGKNQYYIASQGVLLKIDENGNTPNVKSYNAEGYDDATLFNIKRTENGFSLQVDGGKYLDSFGDNGITTSDNPNTTFKITDQDITVSDGVQTIGSYKFYSIAVPYKVKKPASDGTNKCYTFVFSKEGNEIKATDVDVVPAGVPFLYVTKGSNTLTIPTEDQDYKLEVSKENNVLDGFFYAITTTSNLHTDALIFGKKDGKLGYFVGSTIGSNGNDQSAFGDMTAANRGYFEAKTAEELGAAAFELDFKEETGALTVKIISAETGLINDCVALAKELQTIKNNVGTETGKYNVGDDTLENGEETIWNNLDDYANAEGSSYNKSKTDLEALKAQLESILHKVKETNVHGLKEVEIVTLQWNGNGNYSGINGGTDWENPGSFGNPWGGNGRIGLVRKTDETATNRYYIACQGQFLKIDEEGNPSSSTNGKENATAFITIRSSENGLTFVTANWKHYLTGETMRTSTEAQTSDYQINTWGKNNDKDNGNAQATNVRVSDNATTCGDYKYASITLPYQVQKPTGDQYHAFLLSQTSDGITASEPEDGIIPAGAPFLFVYPSNEGNVYMPIPQENQAYSETPATTYALKGFYMALQDGDDLKTSAFALGTNGEGENKKIGYFSEQFNNENTPANRGYISAETANELNAESFELVYEDGNLTVNIVKPTVSVMITEAGWATLYSDKALDFSAVEGLTAYTATVDDEQTTVTLTEVSDVPAGTGVVLKGDDKEYKIPVTTESTNEDKGSLTGSVDKALNYTDVASGNSDYYILALNNSTGNVQFTKLTSGSVAAGKAYLELTTKTDGAARVLSVVFEGETTGIVDTNREATADGRIYNLNGQSVAQPAKGLYIVNGKKVVIK